MTTGVVDRLRAILPEDRIGPHAPLARYTTFRIGGPADWLVDVRSTEELRRVIAAVREGGTPLTLLGGGSNVLIADQGIRGVVVRLRLTGISQPGADRVRAEGGVTMNGLVRWTIMRGLAGLEAWAGTPGTVGGAIYGNAHFSGEDIGTLVLATRLVAPDGTWHEVPAADMRFAYDASRLQETGEILVSADFAVADGQNAEALRQVARASLAFRKRTQPLALASAGCVFQNPVPGRDPLPAGMPASAGALVDRAGLKAFRVGGASISTVHANFVVNDGTATAADVRAVIETARERVRERFGVTLRDEVVFLGQF
jgi:UDP-N-acetylmuramate dehydrogenase